MSHTLGHCSGRGSATVLFQSNIYAILMYMHNKNRANNGQLLHGYKRSDMKTHGMSRTPIYNAWDNMIQRVRKDPYYINITICDKWRKFQNFYDDMGKTYSKGLWLERIDNNKGYSKKNCRWATHAEQQRNRKNCRYLAHKGKTMTIAEWAREIGVPDYKLRRRIDRGWDTEKALVF